jgi:hypothetical protein
MIVSLAACVFLLQVAIGVGAMLFMPRGSFGLADFVSLLICGLIVWMSIGLLNRRPWARWLAVGYSLLGWSLGTFFLAYLGVTVIKAPTLFAVSVAFLFMSLSGILLLLLCLFFVVCVIVDFKLYFYLRSAPGAAEFDVQLEPDASVARATGVWVGAYLLVYLFTNPGMGSLFPKSRARLIDMPPREIRDDRRRSEIEWNERQRREASERAASRARSEAPPPEVSAESSERTTSEAREWATTPAESKEATGVPQPPVSRDDEETGKPAPNAILKCRDSSGAVQYTQGYCPAGTTRVEPQS